MRPGALRGHVSVAQVGTVTGAGAARATPLIALTVTGSHPATTAAAANALAKIVVGRTTASYVGVKIRTFQTTLDNVDRADRVGQGSARGDHSASEKAAKNLDPFQQLVIVSQEDNAETRLGNLIAQQETLQQQLAFAKEVESAKVVVPARSVKASAHSRNTSLLVGALIGLILGADRRDRRRRPNAHDGVRVTFIIPAYNEARTIGEVLERVAALELDQQVIVVDDGSVDGTGDLAARARRRARPAPAEPRQRARRSAPRFRTPTATSPSSRTPTWSTTRPRCRR